MNTPDSSRSPATRTPLKRIVRRLFLVIGGLSALLVAAYLVMWLVYGIQMMIPGGTGRAVIYLSVLALAVLFFCYMVILVIRAVLGRPALIRHGLVGLAALITLAAIFYTEENWRGKRAWENCKRELAAKGAVLDWAAFIPPAVPDDQNFFAAPRMTEWFVGRGARDLHKRMSQPVKLSPAHLANWKTLIVAQVKAASSVGGPNPDNAGVVLKMNDPAVYEQARKLILDIVGQKMDGSQNFTFVGRSFDQIQPAQITLVADKTLTKDDVTDLFCAYKAGTVTNLGSLLEVTAGGDGAFQVEMRMTGYIYTADEYLAWSDQFEPDFALIHEALKRPYARINSSYERANAIGIPNFVGVRSTAQMLASRAQCFLLLGQPDKAWHELAQISDLCRLFEGRPTGKPMTLVAAMINVAVRGVYVNVILDGLRMQEWREPQLAAIQAQLGEADLIPYVADAFRFEQASVPQTFETITPDEYARAMWAMSGGKTPGFWKKMEDPIYRFMTFAPHGWVRQNLVTHARRLQELVECFDPGKPFIQPHQVDAAVRDAANAVAHGTPYNFIERQMLPNFSRAVQTATHNQTLVNEARIACALERYRLAQGQYPETLSALVPQFIEKIPVDIIGGQPLKYRRENNLFVLYSVGWNETDDGGVAANPQPSGWAALDHGDWVWPQF